LPVLSPRSWLSEAVREIEADARRSSDTHLVPLPLPAYPEIQLYFKDESTHPTGSLKHRLARSLFLHALVSGRVGPETPVIEASSGSTAVSEAYFARLLGLRFLAVMPRGTSREKVRRIEFYGGECVFVDDPRADRAEALRLARELNGCYLDQFTNADVATDWRGNNNIAESLFEQMTLETNPVPRWIVCGAGTGGTSATLGRYVRYRRFETRVCVVDPETSVFHEFYATGDRTLQRDVASGIEGIGRPRVEPSFLPEVVDRMVTVPNAAAFAAVHFLETTLGRRCGGSTGANLYGAFTLIGEMVRRGEPGSVVTLICDGGDLYRDTYYSPDWLARHGYDLAPWLARYDAFYHGDPDALAG
jgi:cysteine synthase